MDYVIGGVAALISGNVTPNRPKFLKRALTPTKHQPSPNVTPKSEVVDDRSIFLSPSVQKKKAIVKKSPKRIFQNPDLDVTCDPENMISPKADKVKKHLQEDLEDDNRDSNHKTESPRKAKNKLDSSLDCKSFDDENKRQQSKNENSPKKKKKKAKVNNETIDENLEDDVKENNIKNIEQKTENDNIENAVNQSPIKKKKKKTESNSEHETELTSNLDLESNQTKLKKAKENNETTKEENVRKKKMKKVLSQEINIKPSENVKIQSPKKKKKKGKVSNIENQNMKSEILNLENNSESIQKIKKSKKTKVKNFVNPNAITNKDTDSEHESDDEILSENEEVNKEILKTELADESSDEDEEASKVKKTEKKHVEKTTKEMSSDEIKRTLFVGNVPFSKKCKKEIKKIFSKYGTIETVRIRTVPVKDARVTPKMAIIKNELHPERSTVNVYVKFQDASSVNQALVENNTVVGECHLRVTRSDTTGAEHNPHNAVFVGNVPFAIEDETLREKFAKCGEIDSVRIIRDKKTNAGKGFAYVNFASKDGVELALAMSEEDLTIKNRIMRVKRCTQTNRRTNQQPGSNVNAKNNGHAQRKNQSMHGQKFGGKGFKQQDGKAVGAERRIMHKRKNQETGDGPEGKKRKHINQSNQEETNEPHKEKKIRKEFVGMTAEKKKKHTFSKGMKKKKALSEILTKYQK